MLNLSFKYIHMAIYIKLALLILYLAEIAKIPVLNFQLIEPVYEYSCKAK